MGSHAAACLLSLELLSRQEASYCFHPCLSIPISRSNKFVFFFVLFLAVLGLLLHGLFSGEGELGLLFDSDAWASHCSGFCCCRAWAAGHMGLSRLQHSCSSQNREHRLSTCGTGAKLLHSLWDLLRPGSNPCSCSGRQMLYHSTTREAPQVHFLKTQFRSCNRAAQNPQCFPGSLWVNLMFLPWPTRPYVSDSKTFKCDHSKK